MGKSADGLTGSRQALPVRCAAQDRATLNGARAAFPYGAGFLSSHFIRELLSQSVEVVAVDNLVTGRDLLGVLGHGPVTFIRHDIVEPFDIDGPVDFIFNLEAVA